MSSTLPSSSASQLPDLSNVLASVSVLQRYHVRVHGSGEQTLMFCNGFGCSQHIWQYMIPALAKRYRLVLFDYPGMGEADHAVYDAQKYSSLAGYAQDVVEICRALELEHVVLVGHSVGCTIAMLAAIQAPNYVEALVMLAPSPCYLNGPDYYGGFEQEDLLQLLELMKVDYDGWANLFANLLLGSLNPVSLSGQLARYFCQADMDIAQQFARVTFFSDNRSDVPRLQARTLVLQCAQDVAAPAEVGDYLLQHLPQATLVHLQATGHCPHLSAPLETLAAMDAFLA